MEVEFDFAKEVFDEIHRQPSAPPDSPRGKLLAYLKQWTPEGLQRLVKSALVTLQLPTRPLDRVAADSMEMHWLDTDTDSTFALALVVDAWKAGNLVCEGVELTVAFLADRHVEAYWGEEDRTVPLSSNPS